MNVAEEVCHSLVYPSEWYHGDWETILPNIPSEIESNITFLLKSLVGLRDSDIDSDDIDILTEILILAQNSEALAMNTISLFVRQFS